MGAHLTFPKSKQERIAASGGRKVDRTGQELTPAQKEERARRLRAAAERRAGQKGGSSWALTFRDEPGPGQAPQKGQVLEGQGALAHVFGPPTG